MVQQNIDKQAMLFGYIMGDGWLSINSNHKCIGASGDVVDLETIKNDLIELYGDIGKATIFTNETESPKYNIKGTTNKCNFNVKIAEIFKNLGMPVGKRTEQEAHIPSWILYGSMDTKISFLSGYYSADGTHPNVQRNNKTQRCLELIFYKRKTLEKNGDELLNEFGKIINDLGLTYTYTKIDVMTKELSIKYNILIDNNLENSIRALSLFDFRYCIRKEKDSINLLYYLLYKQSFIDRYNKVKKHCEYNEIHNIKESNKSIAQKYGVTERKVIKIKTGANKCSNAKSIMKYDDFLTMLSALNPVKQGKLSDMYNLVSDLSCVK